MNFDTIFGNFNVQEAYENFTNTVITTVNNIFEEKHEEVKVTCKEPTYRKLNIFKTKFGQILEEFLHNYCKESSILDDLINVKNANNSQNSSNDVRGIDNEIQYNSVEYQEKYIIIKGNLQSGKTKNMISLAIKQLMFGFSSIIMFRNITNDHVQTKQRLELCIKEFIKFAERNGINKNQFIIDIKIFDDLTDIAEIDKMITANPPIICILISNETRMKKITDRLVEFQEGQIKYTMFIDEADLVDSTTAETHKIFVNRLKQEASLVVGVSATILALYSEWDLRANCIRELPIPENYLGLLDLKTVYKNTGINHICKNYKINKIFETIPCLKDHLHEIGNGILNNELCYEKQAMVDLVSLSHMIKPQKQIFNYMIKTFPNVASIIMVESGIRVYHPSLGNVSINLNGNHSNVSDDIHHFTSRNDIGSIMGLLERKGNCTIKNVAIFAGNKANRAITFSSSGLLYNSEEESMKRWHVKRALLKFSKDITQDEAMQRAGRLCGIFAPGSKQILCASLKDLEIVKKAYHVQEDVLNSTARRYGNMKEENIKVNSASDAKVSVAFSWTQNNDVTLDLTLGGRHLINNLELSLWKTRVVGKTPTGRKKTFEVGITNRDSVNPEKVVNDGRHREEDFDFLEQTTGIEEEQANVGNVQTRGEILRILRLFPGLTAVEIFNKSDNWNFIRARDPFSTVSNAVKTMSRNGDLTRTGRPFRYTIV